MTVVAIQQPNYAPWLGYFYKMAQADIFVILDDVQYSKQGYTNRVRIIGENGPRWLSQPVRVSLGQRINEVEIARQDWAQAHLDSLRGIYRKAPAFGPVFADIAHIYAELPGTSLADVNQVLIEELARLMGVQPMVCRSSEIETGDATGDDRLIAIVDEVAPGGTYLSGKGGAGYQDDEKFRSAGLTLSYVDFSHPVYAQARPEFIAGLSTLDAAFQLGWDGAAALIRP